MFLTYLYIYNKQCTLVLWRIWILKHYRGESIVLPAKCNHTLEYWFIYLSLILWIQLQQLFRPSLIFYLFAHGLFLIHFKFLSLRLPFNCEMSTLKMELCSKSKQYIHMHVIDTRYLWNRVIMEDIDNWTRSYILISIYWNRQK